MDDDVRIQLQQLSAEVEALRGEVQKLHQHLALPDNAPTPPAGPTGGGLPQGISFPPSTTPPPKSAANGWQADGGTIPPGPAVPDDPPHLMPPGPQPGPGSPQPRPGRVGLPNVRRRVPGPPRPETSQPASAASRTLLPTLLSILGAVVTLIGLALLLVFASQQGWLGPQARTVTALVISLILLGAGARVRLRWPGNVGAVALAAVGTGGLALVVLSATAEHHWIAPIAGLVLLTALAVGVMLLALAWDSSALATVVVVCVLTLSTGVAGDIKLGLGYTLPMALLTGLAHLRRRWPALVFARVVPATLTVYFLLLVESIGSASSIDDPPMVVAVVVLAGLGVVEGWFARCDRMPIVHASFAVPLSLPFVWWAAHFDDRITGLLLLALAAVWLMVSWLSWFPLAFRYVGVVGGAILLTEGLTLAVHPPFSGVWILGVGAAHLLVGRWRRLPSRFWVGAAMTGIGVLQGLQVWLLVFLPYAQPHPKLYVRMATLLAMAAAAWALRWAVVMFPPGARAARWLAWAVSVGCASAVLVNVLRWLLPGHEEWVGSHLALGFVLGHALVTVGWLVAGAVLLLRGLRDDDAAGGHRLAGLVFAVAVAAKLLLFDLMHLQGLVRIVAFLVSGLLLIGTGLAYARALAHRRSSEDTPQQ